MLEALLDQKDTPVFVQCPLCAQVVSFEPTLQAQTCSCGSLLGLGGILAPDEKISDCKLCHVMAKSHDEDKPSLGCY